MQNLFKDLGVGVGLRPEHYSTFTSKKPEGISWIEAVSENYMDWKCQEIKQPLAILEKVRAHLPVSLHGVSLNIGAVDDIDRQYLRKLKKLIDIIEPTLVSDHLCWTGINKENLHDLLPLPYTQEAVKVVVKKIKQVQDYLGRRILMENVSSYAEFTHSEMKEWDFLSEIANQADCGILLDVNNIYVSSKNHNFDPLDYLKGIPYHRVGQIHLAGHTNKGRYLIDTHDEPVCEDVWNLYKWVVRNLGLKGSMIERDDNIPEWNVLYEEVSRIDKIRSENGSRSKSQGASEGILRRFEESTG